MAPKSFKLQFIRFWTNLFRLLIHIFFKVLLVFVVLFVAIVLLGVIYKMLYHMSGMVTRGLSLRDVLDEIETDAERQREARRARIEAKYA